MNPNKTINMNVPKAELPKSVIHNITSINAIAMITNSDITDSDTVDVEKLEYRLKTIQRDLTIAKRDLSELFLSDILIFQRQRYQNQLYHY